MMRKWVSAALAAVFFLLAGPALASDCSGTITTGGTAQVVFTTPVKGLLVMNNSANLMCISFNGTLPTLTGTNCGSGYWVLQPGSATAAGGSFSKPEFMNLSYFAIISASTGDRYSCEMLR